MHSNLLKTNSDAGKSALSCKVKCKRNRINGLYKTKGLAERVGFEPTLEFPLNTLSKRAPSATRPSLRHNVGTGHDFRPVLQVNVSDALIIQPYGANICRAITTSVARACSGFGPSGHQKEFAFPIEAGIIDQIKAIDWEKFAVDGDSKAYPSNAKNEFFCALQMSTEYAIAAACRQFTLALKWTVSGVPERYPA